MLVILTLLTLGGCVSLPQAETTQWRGHTKGRIKARIVYSRSELPTEGWIVESQPEQASGWVAFTKWKASGFRVSKRSYFQVREKFEVDASRIGRFESKDGFNEFCAVNPEHGGYQEGDRIVITNSYDYCARLTRK
ncbi:MAG: hypothetical protein ACREP7_00910 [Lysobacter sp.]